MSGPHQPNVAKNEAIDSVLTRARDADGIDEEFDDELSEGSDNDDDEEKRHDGDSD